jgi:hypothetical protein
MNGSASITIEVKITPSVVTAGTSASPADRAASTAPTNDQKASATTQSGISGATGRAVAGVASPPRVRPVAIGRP